MESNQLTRELLEAGCTREQHPEYVYWSSWQTFCYKYDCLLQFNWETPCGLLVSGKSELGRGLISADASFDGVWYCPENDNPLLRCPYERRNCPHIPQGFPTPHCPCRCTGRFYDYRKSAEKIIADRIGEAHRRYMEFTGGMYCACVSESSYSADAPLKAAFDVEMCIRARCRNSTCVLRKEKRDLRRVNIFYDLRRTWISQAGFLSEQSVSITKGIRVFPVSVARTDAELWLQVKRTEYAPLQNKCVIETPSADGGIYCPTSCGRRGSISKPWDRLEFRYEVEHIYIASMEHRDFAQDVEEMALGIDVRHASDLKKEAAAQKRTARQHAQESRLRRKTQRAEAMQMAEQQLSLYGDCQETQHTG